MTGSKKGGGPGYEYRTTMPAFEVTGEVRPLSNVGAPALEQIKALPAKWRREADEFMSYRIPPPGLTWDNGAADAKRDDANQLAAALQALRDEAGEAVQQLAECFRLAGGDTECVSTPEGQAKQAAEVVRDLRACYDEAIRPAPAAEAAPQGAYEGVGCVFCDLNAEHWGELCTAATPPSAPAVEAIPQAAVWLEQNGQDATMEWQAGWDACRVEYPSRRLSAPVPQEGVDEASEPDGYTAYGEFRWACDADEHMRKEWMPLWTAAPTAARKEDGRG